MLCLMMASSLSRPRNNLIPYLVSLFVSFHGTSCHPERVNLAMATRAQGTEIENGLI